MLNVFLTVDVEVWCDGWVDLDKKFPSAFQHYIYGKTSSGEYGLPFQIRILNEFDLKAVFFVEPLFATRFGISPLEEIVGMLKRGGQEVQMHMHPEWVDESLEPILKNVTTKRQHMKHYSFNEQNLLIKNGLDLMRSAGESEITAFRAGGFAANNDTLNALSANGIKFDSSYNFTECGRNCEIDSDADLFDATLIEGIHEYPMSCYVDYPKHFRHLQIGACSFGEIKNVLNMAEKKGYNSVVILLHSFEFLTRNMLSSDKILLSRFENLCKYLAENSEKFNVTGFRDLTPVLPCWQPPPLSSSLLSTFRRYYEQYTVNKYNASLDKSIG